MNTNPSIASVILGLLLATGFGIFVPTAGSADSPNPQQSGGSPDGMAPPMNPNQQQMEKMSGHHKKQPAISNSNPGIKTIKLYEAVGKTAPNFALPRRDGSLFLLSNYKDKTVVLFFSEGAMCYPACWDQIASLGSDKRFNNDNVISVSIVTDKKDKWDKIIRAQPKFGVGTLLFDTDASVSRAYDVLNTPSSMHRGSLPGHTYFIINKGIISYVLDDDKMALNNDQLASKL